MRLVTFPKSCGPLPQLACIPSSEVACIWSFVHSTKITGWYISGRGFLNVKVLLPLPFFAPSTVGNGKRDRAPPITLVVLIHTHQTGSDPFPLPPKERAQDQKSKEGHVTYRVGVLRRELRAGSSLQQQQQQGTVFVLPSASTKGVLVLR